MEFYIEKKLSLEQTGILIDNSRLINDTKWTFRKDSDFLDDEFCDEINQYLHEKIANRINLPKEIIEKSGNIFLSPHVHPKIQRVQLNLDLNSGAEIVGYKFDWGLFSAYQNGNSDTLASLDLTNSGYLLRIRDEFEVLGNKEAHQAYLKFKKLARNFQSP